MFLDLSNKTALVTGASKGIGLGIAIEIERTKVEALEYAATWGPVTLMRRVGVPKDVACAVSYFASNEADFVTGQTLFADGGLFTRGV